MEQGKKICHKCSLEKDISEYTKNKRYKDGKESKCKTCFKLFNAARKEKRAEAQRKWREKNPEYMKEYMILEKKSKEYQKNYYKENS